MSGWKVESNLRSRLEDYFDLQERMREGSTARYYKEYITAMREGGR